MAEAPTQGIRTGPVLRSLSPVEIGPEAEPLAEVGQTAPARLDAMALAQSRPYRLEMPTLELEVPRGRRCGVSFNFENDNLSLVNGLASSDDGRTHGSSTAVACRLTDASFIGAFHTMEMFTEVNAYRPDWSNWDPGAERLDLMDLGVVYGRAMSLNASTDLSVSAFTGVRMSGGMLRDLQGAVHDSLEGARIGWGLRSTNQLPGSAPETRISPMVGGAASLEHAVSRHLSLGFDGGVTVAPENLSEVFLSAGGEVHQDREYGPYLRAAVVGQIAHLGGNLRSFDGAPREELTYSLNAGVGWRFRNGWRAGFDLQTNDRGTQPGLGNQNSLIGALTVGRSF
ncbi:MAG: hypothetical protein AAF654_08385 [Myxococcota bacterium]